MGSLEPEFFDGEDMRAALAARDIGAVYRLLGCHGVSQRRIAQLTGQSQSEVCEILKGRQVVNVWVLERITDGLGISRSRMGLGHSEQAPQTRRELDGPGQRRVLVALTLAAAMGQELGAEPELALPSGRVLPSRVEMVHVHTVRALTERLRGLARSFGGYAEVLSAAAQLYTPWMHAPANDVVHAALAAALAELHTEAGWCRYDAGLDPTAHFSAALRLSARVRDTYGIANTAWQASITLLRTGHPNDALKLLQLGAHQLRPQPDNPRIAALTARLGRMSAAYARMNGANEALRCLAEANEGWEPQDTFERAGAELITAGIHRDLGQFETAARFAATARRAYSDGHFRRGHTLAHLLHAEIHIRTGDPQGLTLARQAITGLSALHSLAARRDWLTTLATALQARPGTDHQELARTAREIATRPL